MTGKSEARWRAEPYPYERAVALASELGVSHTTAAVLVRRGFADGSAARSFLEGAEQHDPDLFAGIADAVAVVMRHVAGGTPIAIHGDYDVDGVCSAAVLASALEALGARGPRAAAQPRRGLRPVGRARRGAASRRARDC